MSTNPQNSRIDVDDVKARADIVRVIEAYTPLVHEHGDEWRGVEHDSLTVSADVGLWKWWAKEIGGDVIRWVEVAEHLDFLRAVARVNEIMAGAPARQTLPAQPRAQQEYAKPTISAVERAQAVLAKSERGQLLWAADGFTDDDCGFWRFGFDVNPSGLGPIGECLVIPTFAAGELKNIKYRIVGRTKDKYRNVGAPHMFNSDVLAERDVVIVEGEKKAALLALRGVPAVGIQGVGNFRDEWLPMFAGKRVTFAFDESINPYRLPCAVKIAGVADEARVMWLSAKPDDLFIKYGWTIDDFERARRMALRMTK